MKPPVFHRTFHYDRRLLPNPHLATLEDGVSSIEQATAKTGATIGYPGWGLIYYLLLSHLDRSRRETIIETGTNWGTSTIVLAQALIDAGCDGSIATFELDPENAARARANFEAANVASRISLIEGDSRINLPAYLSQNCERASIRFAFLDASHLETDIQAEFAALLPYLTDDALVVFDNTYRIAEPHEDQRVNGFLRKLPSAHGGNLINLEYVSWFTPGAAIWQRVPRL